MHTSAQTIGNTFMHRLQKWFDTPFFRHIFHPQQIPLLYSIVVVTSIFYHYGAEYTPLWFICTALLQWGIFRLLDFVNRHHLLGGALYVVAGIFVLILAQGCITVGGDPSMFGGMFAPVGTDISISFMVWFLTPQSVLSAFYGPYTVALFLLFTFFIATITFYYSHVRHRVFMSFSIMCFPFTIYAKEAETMPIPFIMVLFLLYFVVMILCRQMHSGNERFMQAHLPGQCCYRLPEPESLPKVRVKELIEMERPELFSKKIWQASALFLGGASILVLILPKPHVTANRNYMESMLEMQLSTFTDYLLNSISAFSDTSDGGVYNSYIASQTLYYVSAEETLNLRLSTYTNYDYETDSWSADEMDRPSEYYRLYEAPQSILADTASPYAEYLSDNTGATPYDYYLFFCAVAEEYPALAEEYGFANIVNMPLDGTAFLHSISLTAATFNGIGYLSPLHTVSIGSNQTNIQLYQSTNGIFFRRDPATIRRETFTLQYLSPQIADTTAMQYLLQNVSSLDMTRLLLNLMYDDALYNKGSDLYDLFVRIDADHSEAFDYSLYADAPPDDVTALAQTLTEGLSTDYEKAVAISSYLQKNYTYDAEFLISDADNVQTFLFENKTGVCYQFASAMTELCRAAGLTARYVEGYALAEANTDTRYPTATHVIRTKHAHAFTEVYLPGYGWCSFDATAINLNGAVNGLDAAEGVVNTLQRIGVVLLIAAVLAVLFCYFLLPLLLEWLFRRTYRRHMDAPMMMKAFVRLKKQWHTPDSATIREACSAVRHIFVYDNAAVSALAQLQVTIETVIYGEQYSPQAAEQCYTAYCTLRDSYKKLSKKQRKNERDKADAQYHNAAVQNI